MDDAVAVSSNDLPKSAQVAPPIRILVQTVTGLVPGDLYPERLQLMRNIICQHHWNRDFDISRDRFYARYAEFGFDNRVCYFLLDSGIDLVVVQKPSVLWYRWTGESLVAIDKPLPNEIRDYLEEYPFQNVPSRGPGKLRLEPDAVEQRRIIKARLHCNMPVTEGMIDFLREHHDQAEKLKDGIEPRFWSKLEAFAKSRQGGFRSILPRIRIKKKSKR